MVLDLSGYEDRELGQLGKTSVRTSSKFLVKIQNNDPVEKQTLQVKLLHPLQFQLLLEYYIVHAQLTSQTCSPFSTRVKIQAGAVSCPGLKKNHSPKNPIETFEPLVHPTKALPPARSLAAGRQTCAGAVGSRCKTSLVDKDDLFVLFKAFHF